MTNLIVELPLLAPTETEEPLYITLSPQIQALVATMNPDDLNVSGDATPEEAIALLRSWSEESDDDDEDVEAWEAVLRSIDANRTSYRKLFPELEQPE